MFVRYNSVMSVARIARLACPLLWVLLAACPRNAPMPRVATPLIVPRTDAALALPESRLSIRLETDLRSFEGMLAETLNQRLSLKQDDWTRVTAEGETPEVETRMKASVETPQLRMQRGALAVTVPIAYWGKVRAQAKTPFGTLWLSHGLDWGTQKAPGRISLTLRIVPKLDERFRLSTQTSLVDVDLRAPPGEELCGRLVVKVCVPRETAAKQVHGELEKQIRKNAPSLLSTLDARVGREPKIAQLVDLGLATLRNETRLSDGSHLSIEPMALSTGAFEGSGEKVVLPLELSFAPHFQSQPKGALAVRPLEGRKQTRREGELHLDLTLPFADWSQAIQQSAASFDAVGFRISRVAVLGASGERAGALVIGLTLVRDAKELTVYLTALPSIDAATLVLSAPQWTLDSERALTTLELDAARLREIVVAAAKTVLSQGLKQRVEHLQAKLSVPFVLFGSLTLSTSDPRFDALRFGPDALIVRAHATAAAKL